MEAEEELSRGVDDDGRFHALVLDATDSEERASAALTARLAERLRRGEKPTL